MAEWRGIGQQRNLLGGVKRLRHGGCGTHRDGGGLRAVAGVAVCIGWGGHGLIGVHHALVADDGASSGACVDRGFKFDGDRVAGGHRAYRHTQWISARIDYAPGAGQRACYVSGVGRNRIGEHHASGGNRGIGIFE